MDKIAVHKAYNQGYQDTIDGNPFWFGIKPACFDDTEWWAYKFGVQTARVDLMGDQNREWGN